MNRPHLLAIYLLCFVSFDSLFCELTAGETPSRAIVRPEQNQDRSSDLLKAQKEADLILVADLLKRGTNADATDANGEGILHFAVLELATVNRTEAHESHQKGIEHVRLILNYGGNPNRGNRQGITPLMIALRSGDEELIQLLKQSGGAIIDETDPRMKAAFIWIDARIMKSALWGYAASPSFSEGDCKTGDPAEKLPHAHFPPPISKVAKNGGKDLLGNSYILDLDGDDPAVRVNPATAAAFSGFVSPDFWGPYAPPIPPPSQ